MIHNASRMLFVAGSLRGSARLHTQLLRGVLAAPQRFFDATPHGRVLNRFTSDQSKIDRPVRITHPPRPPSLAHLCLCLFCLPPLPSPRSHAAPTFLLHPTHFA